MLRRDERRHPIGSPPRVRGIVRSIILPWKGARITPACAGNREKLKENDKDVKDHPRVCGE